MPFTLAHPAIIIPLHKTASRYQGLLSALIIGSMIPDFSYFIPLGVTRYESHTWLALLWFSLPVGLMFYLVYHTLLVPVVYSFLPHRFQRRLNPTFSTGSLPPLNLIPLIAAGIVFGAATHLFWDSFTHSYSYNWPVQHFEILKSTAFHIGNFPLKVYRLLQHLSSVIGLIIVFLWIRRWYHQADQNQLPRWQPSAGLKRFALILLFTLPLIAGLYYAVSLMDRAGPLAYRSIMFMRDWVIFGGRILLPLWLLLGLYYQYLIRKQTLNKAQPTKP